MALNVIVNKSDGEFRVMRTDTTPYVTKTFEQPEAAREYISTLINSYKPKGIVGLYYQGFMTAEELEKVMYQPQKL